MQDARSDLTAIPALPPAIQCCQQASGKMVLLAKLLPKLRAEGHKVLIFSQVRWEVENRPSTCACPALTRTTGIQAQGAHFSQTRPSDSLDHRH